MPLTFETIDIKSPVIFDMDGVIVDTEPLDDQHVAQFLAGKFGMPDSYRIQASYKGMNAQAAWPLILHEIGVEYPLDLLINEARQSYIDFLEALPQLPAIPGVVELIAAFKTKGHPLAIASSANPKRIELILDKLDISHYFDIIVHGDDIEHSKPAPDAYILAAQRLGAAATSCVAIEDTYNGVSAAKTAGMWCIGYAGNGPSKEDLSAADLIISDFNRQRSLILDFI